MTDTRRAAMLMLIFGGITISLSLGLRHGFGLFLQPVSMANGWGREVFGFAIAIQNLVWGAAQPFTGMLADRIGAGKVIVGGAVFYVAGLALMAVPQSASMFVLSAGVLVGIGLSGTTFPIVFGAVNRAMPPERRSMAMGITMAVGSFGQFVMLPGSFWLIETFGWSGALVALSVLAAAMIPCAAPLFETPHGPKAAQTEGPGVLEAVREAFSHRGFVLLTLGFFVCGFQLIFIGTHLPAFLADRAFPPVVASIVLALVGLTNIAGSYYAGLFGGRRRKPGLLAWVYLLRGGLIAAFVLLPITEWTAYAFGFLMGLFWLSTVPLTNGTISSIFGVRNMSMLAGFVFFSHQVGAFLGGWLGGLLYDHTGSYDIVWALAVGLSLVAAMLNLPIREEPIVRRAAGAAAE